jgi:type III secretory pathway component EscS
MVLLGLGLHISDQLGSSLGLLLETTELDVLVTLLVASNALGNHILNFGSLIFLECFNVSF